MKFDWNSEPIIVLDACALIAFLNDEPGAETVVTIFEAAQAVEMAAVNLLEVAYDAIRSTGETESAGEIVETVQHLPINIRWSLSQPSIEIAAQLKTSYRISLADSIAIALAVSENAPLATSDHHKFDSLQNGSAARFLWIR